MDYIFHGSLEMIDAQHARQKALSANNGKIQEVLSRLAVQITQATERGLLETSIGITGLSDEQRQVVRQEVQKHGYTTKIDEYSGDFRDPSYTNLIVKW